MMMFLLKSLMPYIFFQHRCFPFCLSAWPSVKTILKERRFCQIPSLRRHQGLIQDPRTGNCSELMCTEARNTKKEMLKQILPVTQWRLREVDLRKECFHLSAEPPVTHILGQAWVKNSKVCSSNYIPWHKSSGPASHQRQFIANLYLQSTSFSSTADILCH